MFNLPNNHDFAFTIIDDTDDATFENIAPVYDYLYSKGLRVTKTVWPKACPEGSEKFFAGECLEISPRYLSYVIALKEKGFEIAFHGATMESSKTERTLAGLEYIKEQFGFYPRLHCNHAQNLENLYWGFKRFNFPLYRSGIQLLHNIKKIPVYLGDEEPSDYFWGDLSKSNFDYVRSFTFDELNLLNITKHPIYRLNQTPWVNNWFITSDAPNVMQFNQLVTPKLIDKLVLEKGICILSTHLGKGYCRQGKLDDKFATTIDYLSKLNGWFVPASDILDYMKSNLTIPTLSNIQLFKFESKYIIEKAARKIHGS